MVLGTLHGMLMFPQDLTNDQIKTILAQLEQALYSHQIWYNDLVRAMVCNLPFDPKNIAAKPHEKCRFGCWYYSDAPKALKLDTYPNFVVIGKTHQEMHRSLKKLLQTIDDNKKISPEIYDDFNQLLNQFKIEMNALKYELETLFSSRDSLTMAQSKSGISPALQEQQISLKAAVQTTCVAMLDIDFFKKVNDRYGHLVGDKVLKAISHYLIDHLRLDDQLFRYGGEEFVIIMQKISLFQAEKILNRLREGIAALPIDIGKKNPIYIKVSIGVALLDINAPTDNSIDHADKAMYAAKKAGRNTVKIWDEKIN